MSVNPSERMIDIVTNGYSSLDIVMVFLTAYPVFSHGIGRG